MRDTDSKEANRFIRSFHRGMNNAVKSLKPSGERGTPGMWRGRRKLDNWGSCGRHPWVVTRQQRLEWYTGASLVEDLGKRCPGRRSSRCEGAKAGMSLDYPGTVHLAARALEDALGG